MCGTTYNLHRHHIYEGTGRRQNSDKYGAWVYLCAYHHNMSDDGVHGKNGGKLDELLKIIAQHKLEETMSRDEFRRHFGRSYL